MPNKLLTTDYWKQNRLLNLAVVFFIALLILFLTLALLGFIFQTKYTAKAYPGIYVGETALGGKTEAEVNSFLNSLVAETEKNGILFFHGQSQENIYPSLSAGAGDIAVDFYSINTEETAKNIFQYGRKGNYFSDWMDALNASVYGQRIFLVIEADDEKIKGFLSERFSPVEVQAKNAELQYADSEFSLAKEETGTLVNYEKALNAFKNNLRRASLAPVEIEINGTAYPEITYNDAVASQAAEQASSLINQAPLTLTYQLKEWKIDKVELAAWLTLKKEYPYCRMHADECASIGDKKIKVGISEEKAKEYFEKNILSAVDIPAQEAKFKMENGRVNIFQAGRDGQTVNLADSLARAEFELAVKNNNKVVLEVAVTRAAVQDNDLNNLGIKEIIGTGQSNFAGSPKNRRHNIANGARILNGIIIKPGEEFSIIRALGEINAKTGYLTELVIKGNKTIPEYGGGLCQIGTTVFRAALASGLPITARSNHSYRVQYYEPAGTDATIYDPAPDLKFLNDTDNSVLVQSRIDGNNLYFDFWGTKDGRQIVQSKPTIYNIVKPAPTKYIESPDIAEGQTKCTEKAHNGADAYFDYKVTYAAGEVKERRFTSHYRPWQAVCLIAGKKETTAPADSVNLNITPDNAPPDTASSSTP